MNPLAPFDEHIKKQLSGYSPDVPPHVWENIAARKDKKCPGGWLFFMQRHGLKILIPALLAGASAIYWMNTRGDNDSDKSLQPALATVNTNADQSGADVKNTTDNTSAGEQSSNQNQEKINNININSVNTTVDGTPGDQKNDPNNFSQKPARQDLTQPANSQLQNPRPTIATSNPQLPVRNAASGPSKPNKQRDLNRSQNSRTRFNNSPGGLDEDEDDRATSSTSVVNSNTASLQKGLIDVDVLNADKFFNPGIQSKQTIQLNIPCPKPEKNAAGNKRYFELYAGPDYVFRSFSDTANSEYKARRKESTSFSSAFSAGFRFTKVFSNGISFRTGLNYSQVNEKFKFTEGNIIQIIYITNTAGDTTGSYEAVSTRYKTTHNKFRTIDLPIMIGYEMGNGRWHANINAGGVVNIRSWQKGDVLDKNLQPVNINSNAAPSPYQYRTNIGFGFIGAASVYYKLNDRWHLLAEPYIRYNFTPMSKSELTFKQKYTTTGLRLGVRLDF